MSHNRLRPGEAPGLFLFIALSTPFGRIFRGRRVAFRPKSSHLHFRGQNPAPVEIAKLTTSALPSSGFSAASGAPRPLSAETSSFAEKLLACLAEAKAEEVVTIDLQGKTSLADMMIIASGRSTVHVGAIADRVIKTCKAAGVSSPRVEGLVQCDWVLVDAGDVIIHLFRPEVRQFYNLEKMWGGDRPREMRLA